MAGIKISFFITFLFSSLYLQAAVVTVTNRKIYVDGELFIIKGVCYKATPIGEDYNYTWWTNISQCTQDFRLIKQMGANTVRFWDSSIDLSYGAMLDELYNYGLYAIITYYPPDTGWGNPATRATRKTEFSNLVQKWKSKPAVIIWSIGNEHNYRVDDDDINGWYTFVQECAQLAHTIDPDHLVTTANGEINNISTYDSSVPDLDIWSANVYRGRNFGTLFSDYATYSSKPFFFSEFGCDAVSNSIVDEQGQANVLLSQWKHIETNLTVNGGICSGGTIMEWVDEWWKNGNLNTHDYAGFSGSDPRDGIFDEEWWGIVDIDRDKREVYYTIRDYCFKAINFNLLPLPPVTVCTLQIQIITSTTMSSANLKIYYANGTSNNLTLSGSDKNFSSSLIVSNNTPNGKTTLYFWGVGIDSMNYQASHRFIIDTIKPLPPSNINGSSSDKLCSIRWEEAIDNATPIKGYNLYRSTDNINFIKINSQLIKILSYTDTEVQNNIKYFYKVTALDSVNLESEFSESITLIPSAGKLVIAPNLIDYVKYNNINIQFTLSRESRVTIFIYNLNGKPVECVIKERTFSSGIHSIDWRPEKILNNGIYFLMVKTENKKEIKKFMVLKK